jgi:hypothetical protein
VGGGAFVNKVMTIWIPNMLGISCVDERVAASQEELSSMELVT